MAFLFFWTDGNIPLEFKLTILCDSIGDELLKVLYLHKFDWLTAHVTSCIKRKPTNSNGQIDQRSSLIFGKLERQAVFHFD
ncbi:hypothetical protein ASF39_14595 [Methylobacterium sp. Leaf108]|nr:hypothetical protein ASF39_14595 [Methylobacterium sp. Leaf108]